MNKLSDLSPRYTISTRLCLSPIFPRFTRARGLQPSITNLNFATIYLLHGPEISLRLFTFPLSFSLSSTFSTRDACNVSDAGFVKRKYEDIARFCRLGVSLIFHRYSCRDCKGERKRVFTSYFVNKIK